MRRSANADLLNADIAVNRAPCTMEMLVADDSIRWTATPMRQGDRLCRDLTTIGRGTDPLRPYVCSHGDCETILA